MHLPHFWHHRTNECQKKSRPYFDHSFYLLDEMYTFIVDFQALYIVLLLCVFSLYFSNGNCCAVFHSLWKVPSDCRAWKNWIVENLLKWIYFTLAFTPFAFARWSFRVRCVISCGKFTCASHQWDNHVFYINAKEISIFHEVFFCDFTTCVHGKKKVRLAKLRFCLLLCLFINNILRW